MAPQTVAKDDWHNIGWGNYVMMAVFVAYVIGLLYFLFGRKVKKN